MSSVSDVRDFRDAAIVIAGGINAEAEAAGRKPPIELHTDEFVHLKCGETIFIVFRDVVVAGSMYFECAAFGFYKETYRQQVDFDDDIKPDVLDLYLDIAHQWFFQTKILATNIVPDGHFNALIENFEQEPLESENIKIPLLKLAKMAETVILADRFVHRPLLTILRKMFISLLKFTHNCWFDLSAEVLDWDRAYHQDFMFDYIDAFELLCMGHDDEKMLRDALTESFYFFGLDKPSFIQYYRPIFPCQFTIEWRLERDTSNPFRMRDHAEGIFTTDTMVYANKTRQQKDRRFKRVMNLCSPETRHEWLPWFNDPEEKRVRNFHLDQVVEAKRRQIICEREFVPGASIHHGSSLQATTMASDHSRRGRGKNRKSRGGQNSRGGHNQEGQDRVHNQTTVKEDGKTSGNHKSQGGQSSRGGHHQEGQDRDHPQGTVDEDGQADRKKKKRNKYKKNKARQQEGVSVADGHAAESHNQVLATVDSGLTSQAKAAPAKNAYYDAHFPALGSSTGHTNKGRNSGKQVAGNELPEVTTAPETSTNHQATPLTDRDPNIVGRRGRNGRRGRGGGRGRGNGRGGASMTDGRPLPNLS
ncbi:hypothetical protein CkaCkLH20_06042 [Colletotrichum karsti]|uniref:BTB domain-containing protein n=1 Tax=Colletotrichum karsti TaxID=1095194 RepID=A0A9P6I5J1_9PEZI|nr:uncharacterized protein CkaCkLH20_06042 [Colletotrichum karsti]KAF9876634.1 hypothetical protein CkaCkLH20_06042 [Colletotrichum karsti]